MRAQRRIDYLTARVAGLENGETMRLTKERGLPQTRLCDECGVVHALSRSHRVTVYPKVPMYPPLLSATPYLPVSLFYCSWCAPAHDYDIKRTPFNWETKEYEVKYYNKVETDEEEVA